MKRAVSGFSLLELVTVTVVISFVTIMTMRVLKQKTDDMLVNKTVLEMEVVLQAQVAYYVANGRPVGTVNVFYNTSSTDTSINPLYGTYFPKIFSNPWGYAYKYGTRSAYSTSYPVPPKNTVYVDVRLPNSRLARLVEGRFPNAKLNTSVYVTAYVVIPDQKLNNADAINFAGIYHHGACIPVPTCPLYYKSDGTTANMTPQVFLVPVSVSGVNDNGSTNVYPISSFTTYASGVPSATPEACRPGVSLVNNSCSGAGVNGLYWRACMQIITDRGEVSSTRTDAAASYWGKDVSMAAYTRCSPTGEASGSSFSIYGD